MMEQKCVFNRIKLLLFTRLKLVWKYITLQTSHKTDFSWLVWVKKATRLSGHYVKGLTLLFFVHVLYVIGPLINSHCLVSPIQWSHSAFPDWTQGCSLATPTIHFIFFQACRMEKNILRKICFGIKRCTVQAHTESPQYDRNILICVCCMSISNSICVNLRCKFQFSVAALAVLQQFSCCCCCCPATYSIS